MSYGKLNIWLRGLDCCPRNFWKVELVVKTCGGDYLVDFNPDVIDKLAEALPSCTVQRGTRGTEPTIRVSGPVASTRIKHLEVDVPPGCYLVRAWVCFANLWTDRAMAIVGCGGEACVNLIVPQAENCIRDVLVPVAILARDLKLPPGKVRTAIAVLMKTGRIHKEPLLREATDLAKELRESDAKDVPRYVEGLEFMAELVKGTEMEQEQD